ncbi:LamG-like jellyroll fold domain-containing protein [Lentzea sp. NPDC006480]|uniref:LamG-like jellyroll fold domain-containing protein n=1 Tax=Lentzea sp. NPDC006480 TaxID=3157176 RepID=UPI0033ADABA1
MLRRQRLVLTLLALVAGLILPAPTAEAAPVELPTEAAALAAAKKFDKPVEVSGLRTASTKVVANPSGTFTATLAAVPPSSTLGASNWTMINERKPDQSYWSLDRAEGAKVGYVEDAELGWVRYRSIWTFPMGAMKGKHVLRAWFSSYFRHSYSCADSWTDLYVVNSVNADTDWNNHAGSWGRYLAGANNNDCHDTGKYSEWNGGNVTAAAKDGAGWGVLTLGLRAANEGTINDGWKKFDENRTALSVEYNSIPKAPDLLSVEGKACTGQPLYVGTKTPTVRARPRDDDNHVHDVIFGFGERTAPGNGTPVASQATVENIPSGAIAQYKRAKEFTEGATQDFQAWSKDDWDTGPKSATCQFVVDVTKPAMPSIRTEDGRYPADGQIHGGVGVSGDFTFTGTDTDIAGYYYGIADPPTTFVAANALGGPATAGVTPEWRGGNTVYVQAVDRAGNTSDSATFNFRVGSGKPPIGAWNLDEKTGDQISPSVGNQQGQVYRGTLGNPGRIINGPTAVSLPGGTDSRIDLSTVLDTSQSFSVAAWVRLKSGGSSMTAVTQDGVDVAGFSLKYDGGANRWAFTMPERDEYNSPVTSAKATAEPRIGVWTHLAGTYDAATHKLTLYVDGRKAGEKTAPADAWRAIRWLAFGRAKWNDANVENWAGDLADVKVWDRRIYLSEVTELANQLTLLGEWKFDEPSGATMTDTSDFKRDVTFTGTSYHRDPGHNGSGGSVTGSYGQTAGPVVRSSTGFAVSAWVKLEQPDPTLTQAAVAQDGTRNSPFAIQYMGDTKKWTFRLTSADTDTPTRYRALSQKDAVPGQWTHVVGTYDPGAKQIRLFVNGQLESTVTAPDLMWDGSGPLSIGRGRWTGTNWDGWRGGIDDVRVFAGVPTDLDVAALYQQ